MEFASRGRQFYHMNFTDDWDESNPNVFWLQNNAYRYLRTGELYIIVSWLLTLPLYCHLSSPARSSYFGVILVCLAAFNNSMMLSDTRSANQSNQIEQATYIVLGVACSILLLVAVCVMIPAVFSVLHAKQAIFDVMIQVGVSRV